MAMRDGRPYMAFGVMGGNHQAQGHVQVLINFLLHGMTLQEAFSAPRFDFRAENFVAFEGDFPEAIREDLAARGSRSRCRVTTRARSASGLAVAPARITACSKELASDPCKDWLRARIPRHQRNQYS